MNNRSSDGRDETWRDEKLKNPAYSLLMYLIDDDDDVISTRHSIEQCRVHQLLSRKHQEAEKELNPGLSSQN